MDKFWSVPMFCITFLCVFTKFPVKLFQWVVTLFLAQNILLSREPVLLAIMNSMCLTCLKSKQRGWGGPEGPNLPTHRCFLNFSYCFT